MKEIEERFPALTSAKENISSAEYFLPSVVDSLISEQKARVKVIESREKWYGVTYREDKPAIKKAIKGLLSKVFILTYYFKGENNESGI